jgi:uncharacterized protein DUF2752
MGADALPRPPRWTRLAGAVLVPLVPVGLALGAFGSAGLRHELAEGGVVCPFRLATGIPCPFCGLTRATLALGQGDVVGALAFHPLAPVLLALILWLSVTVALGRPVKGLKTSWMLLLVGAVWAVNLVVHFTRG